MSNPKQEIRIGGVDYTVTSLAGDGEDRDVFSVAWAGGVLVMRLGHDAGEFLNATPLEGHGAAFEQLPPTTMDQIVGAAAGIRGRRGW